MYNTKFFKHISEIKSTIRNRMDGNLIFYNSFLSENAAPSGVRLALL